MFSEKEREILQALVEGEIIAAMDSNEEADKEFEVLLADYRTTLTKMLLKINLEGQTVISDKYTEMVSSQLLQRQSVY